MQARKHACMHACLTSKLVTPLIRTHLSACEGRWAAWLDASQSPNRRTHVSVTVKGGCSMHAYLQLHPWKWPRSTTHHPQPWWPHNLEDLVRFLQKKKNSGEAEIANLLFAPLGGVSLLSTLVDTSQVRPVSVMANQRMIAVLLAVITADNVIGMEV